MSHSSPHRYSLPTNWIPSHISKGNIPKALLFSPLSSCDLSDGVCSFFTSDSFLFPLWIKQQIWVPLNYLLIHYPDFLQQRVKTSGRPRIYKRVQRSNSDSFLNLLIFFFCRIHGSQLGFSGHFLSFYLGEYSILLGPTMACAHQCGDNPGNDWNALWTYSPKRQEGRWKEDLKVGRWRVYYMFVL